MTALALPTAPTDIESAIEYQRAVIVHLADGRVTPAQGRELCKAVEVLTRSFKTRDLDRQRRTLEQKVKELEARLRAATVSRD